jgi:ABC-type phosphate transport system substrate-binding protein
MHRRTNRSILIDRRLALALLLSGARLFSGLRPARAESDAGLRVIVHASNPHTSRSREFVADAFLKKVTRWQDGEGIMPVDLKPTSATRRRFSEQLLKRSIGAVRSYWQQRIFSGRDVPPPELDSDEAVASYVAKYPGAIGYVSSASKLVGVKELSIK